MCRVTHVLVVAIIGLPLLLVIWMQAGSLSKITDEDIVAPPPKAIAARRAEHSAAALPSANASMTNRPPLRILCLGDLLTGGYTRGGLPRFNHPYGIRLEQQIRAFLDSNGAVDSALHVEIRGYNGMQCDELIHRLREALSAATATGHTYDAVILLGGTNDLADASLQPALTEREADMVFARLYRMYAVVRPDIRTLEHGAAPVASADAASDRAPKLVAITIPQTANFGAPYASLRAAINARIKAMSADSVSVVDAETAIPYYDVGADGKHGEMNAALWDDALHMTAAGYDALGELVFARAIEPWLKSHSPSRAPISM